MENPIKNNRIISDDTFATRFTLFLKNIQVSDPMSYEELEYMRYVAEHLLSYQLYTVTDKAEKDYLERCHTII
jgi:hypothetical protein